MWTALHLYLTTWHVDIGVCFLMTCKHNWRFNLNLTTYSVMRLMNHRGGPAPKPSAADMWSSPPKRIALLSSSAIMDGGWLPLRPSLCTAEHCEPHEIKLLLKRRITLLGPTLFPSPLPCLSSPIPTGLICIHLWERVLKCFNQEMNAE